VAGHRQVRFYGIDVQAGAVSAERLAARLQQIDPALAAEVGPALAKLAAAERAAPERATAPAEYPAAVAEVAAVLPRIAARLPQPASAADRQAIVDRHYVQVLQQNTQYRSGHGEWRDRGMADNVRWIADVAEPGSRIVVWAHNYHVNNFSDPFPWMGGHLKAALGKDYLPVGFLFHHGAFQAMDRTGGSRGLKEFAVGPPPAGTVEDTFERAGWPLCILDLRRLPPSGPVAEWFRSPQQVRAVGSSFSGEADMAMEVVLPDIYEAVIYVESTTRARPNPGVQP
jgi:erythromycin esterase